MIDWLGKSETLWYAIRSTGIVLLLLLTISTVLGVLSTARIRTVKWPRFVTQAIHRNVALLTLVMLFFHVTGAIMDGFVDVHWYEAFITRPGEWQPTFFGFQSRAWLWMGTWATDIIVAVIATSLVRHQLSHRFWRGVHFLSYASWVLAILHGLGAGSDHNRGWYVAVTVACVGAVAGVSIIRLATAGHERQLAS